MEEAEALLKLKQAKQFTDQALAKIIRKSRQSVNDSLILNDLPESVKAECRTSGIWSKSQLLQVVRAGDEQKMLDTWDSLRRGDIRTILDMRARKSTVKGRPPHYRFLHKPKGRTFQVLVTFSKRKANRAEVSEALRDALKHLP
jgi:ParB family transcriptional regulator, chromosome partitioning protein